MVRQFTPVDEAAVKDGVKEKKRRGKSGTSKIFRLLTSFMPILHWLPNYKWKEYIHGDLIAGLTVGIMHVPQGMAYASLASVPPVYGMYSSFFASTIYMFFGTARHVSIGVFAVASLMVGACRLRLVPDPDDLIANSTSPLGDVTPLELTSALTLVVGVVQILFGVLRLGFLTTYLSDPLVSGFTTGSAAHVMVAQLNKVIGVKLPRHEGTGMLLLMVRDLIYSIPSTNLTALLISAVGILFLDLGRTYINPRVKRISPVPPPLELILVIIGVILSVTLNLKENYGVAIVNTIPRGFPMPSVPNATLVPYLISDGIAIAVICYMFVMSMGKLFAKKHKYRTDATQEFYAVGIMSVASSFFPVYPVGASLSRSSVCEMSGANTQLYTVFSSTLLLTVILSLGPFLEPLPMCILACIVIVSLKSLFLQVKELPRYWRISKYDFAIWLVACLATIVTDVTKGLVISLAFALFSIILREQWPRFTAAQLDEIPPQHVPESVSVVKFESPLHFANVTLFTDKISEMLASVKNDSLLSGRAILVDCTAMAYVDSMGLDALREVYNDAKKSDVTLQFCGLNDTVLDIIKDDEILRKSIPQQALRRSVNEALLLLAAQPNV
ncbi:sulfate transporter and sulfate transporter antisigma-factor antagonist [Trichostrongylus colubriformis]|uniref:Sulfate transporter and sulfate transporter antisigma-factor antagonist n=1 Tax=Trichostrongylus colubriformis TaxID=6319 RepID=A0AAN8IQS4_TRICO